MKSRNMTMRGRVLFYLLAIVLGAAACAPQEDTVALPTAVVSGTLVDGYRVLPVHAHLKNQQLTVFRGDYIKFQPAGFPAGVVLSIPSLSVETTLPATNGNPPFFKMTAVGDYPFTIGDTDGKIRVIEFDQPRYSEVSSKEAAAIIQNIRPLVLDVRTPGEYAQGHIEHAVRIPVQELQRRIGELSGKTADPVLVYCATGNRSTVAAKILIDGGFRRIYNLRHGMAEWVGSGRPVVR